MSLAHVLEMISRSDAGMVRTHNEDALLTNPARGLAILADGMGGYNAGEVAAEMAISLLGTGLDKALAEHAPHLPDPSGRVAARAMLESQIAQANSEIYQASQGQPQYAGMGTTLVAALFYDNSVSVAHVGDSRAYRLRAGRLEPLTRDHSLLQEQIDSGMITAEEARNSQNRNLVTRALGVDPQVEPEIRDFDTLIDDIYLLCSDGLTDMVDDRTIAAVLNEAQDLDAAAARLVQLANDNGGRDNVSVVLVRIMREYPAPRGFWARLLGLFQ